MQEISSSRFADVIETDGALIAAVRGIVRRMSFFVSSGLTAKATKLDMSVSPLVNPPPLAGEEAIEPLREFFVTRSAWPDE
jgi:hypothetical protein